MLSHLYIENIALIDKLTIDFHSGLNIITGETGTGKSIVIDSINLLLGDRADRSLIRSGEASAYIEGIFSVEDVEYVSAYISNYNISIEDNQLIVSRELSTTGNNICRINGRAVTLSTLKDVSRHLIDIHGQHEHQSLLTVEAHGRLLDSFGGNYIDTQKREVAELYRQLKGIKKEIDKLGYTDTEGKDREDYIQYQLSEIDSANLKPDEEAKLAQERIVLQNSEKIIETIKNVYGVLYDGFSGMPSIYDSIGNICSDLDNLSNLDQSLEGISKRFYNIFYELDDSLEQLREYIDIFYFDENRLDQIQERLTLINDLKRKYGSTLSEVIDYGKKLHEELKNIKNNILLLENLRKEEQSKTKELLKACNILSKRRREIADKFESQLLEQLADLGMEKTDFMISIQVDKDNLSSNGFDEVEFLITPNPGEPLKPLNKIASGGEMSRIMLAFKTILARIDDIPTLIFDEIDTGISGRIAQIVAEKMAIISSTRQLICVTHLPQIAAMADRHFLIEKHIEDNRTYTTMDVLSNEQRKKELANMVGSTSLSKTGLNHAAELLYNSEAYKLTLK
ncbi:MAG: DNA repair protein RecN [Clostridiales bacterium]|nr:DNA repair protein RecN [Clostridiales bacterium]